MQNTTAMDALKLQVDEKILWIVILNGQILKKLIERDDNDTGIGIGYLCFYCAICLLGVLLFHFFSM